MRKLARLRHAWPIGVAKIVETDDEILLRERLATTEFVGPGEDARQRALALSVEALVDHSREG